MWDIGGQDSLRPSWSTYYANCDVSLIIIEIVFLFCFYFTLVMLLDFASYYKLNIRKSFISFYKICLET